jgi:hypothetical protein
MTAIEHYIQEAQEKHQAAIIALRNVLQNNLPQGFEEMFIYDSIGFVVPKSLYPKGYHTDPNLPLTFINVASQKNFIALYHFGMYAMPSLAEWFAAEYPKHCKTKLDMGKSCIRFKKPDQIPLALIAELAAKITPEEWVKCYQETLRK